MTINLLWMLAVLAQTPAVASEAHPSIIRGVASLDGSVTGIGSEE